MAATHPAVTVVRGVVHVVGTMATTDPAVTVVRSVVHVVGTMATGLRRRRRTRDRRRAGGRVVGTVPTTDPAVAVVGGVRRAGPCRRRRRRGHGGGIRGGRAVGSDGEGEAD